MLSPFVANAVPVVVWDQSPDGIGGSLTNGNWSNSAVGQNFTDIVSFGTDTLITGMDIYMDASWPSVGDIGTVRIRTGSETAAPVEFNESVTVIDTDGTSSIGSLSRVHVDFSSAFLMLAGVDYWIGMSSADIGTIWTQAGITGGTGALLDNLTARYAGTSFDAFATDVDDLAFRLWGESVRVPEPSPLFLLSGGLLGILLGRRRFARRA